MSHVLYEQVRGMALSLEKEERRKLVDELAETLNTDSKPEPRKPFKSARGALADLGPGPSEEDIAEIRREMWANFPREDLL